VFGVCFSRTCVRAFMAATTTTTLVCTLLSNRGYCACVSKLRDDGLFLSCVCVRVLGTRSVIGLRGGASKSASENVDGNHFGVILLLLLDLLLLLQLGVSDLQLPECFLDFGFGRGRVRHDALGV
jgi:hypothetical protein